jgi:tetrapyrrole methylase family protein/MazG family protein
MSQSPDLDKRLSAGQLKDAEADGLAMSRLLKILKILRAPDGCPWDREQTHRSLRPYLLEECYEVLDAIDREDMNDLREELGDLSLHVAFQAELAEERGEFRLADSLDEISEKLIRRHPHVFGDTKASTPEDVERNWERIKTKEKAERASILDGLPAALPGLLRAQRIQEKVAGVGFEWKDVSGAIDKLKEEYGEFLEALESGDHKEQEAEFGDFLFSIVNIARYLKVQPEDALRRTNDKFCRRFSQLEERLKAAGGSLGESSLEEMDRLWEAVKRDERENSC